MSANLRLHVFRRGELRAGLGYNGLHDPDQMASMSPEKRQALLDCPASDDDEAVQIIGTQGERVIGRMDLVPGMLDVAGQPLRVSWGSALSVPVPFRNTLMGVMLIMKAQALHPIVAASGPSQAVIPIYQKLKWIDLLIPRHVMICRSRSVMNRYLGGGVRSAIAAGLADAMLGIHRVIIGLFSRIRIFGLGAERVDKMDPAYDEILRRQRRPVCAQRSAAWINWQISHSFRSDARDRQSLYYSRNREGKVVGYFINKIRFYETATHRGFKNLLLGSPQDWMVFDASAVSVQALLLLAVRELIRHRVDAIEIASEDPALRALLRFLGFLRVGSMHMMLRAAAGSPLADPQLHNISQWWIRPADGDSFFT